VQLKVPDPAIAWTGASLRPWRSSDAASLLSAWNDAEIARWNPVPAGPTIEQADRWIAGYDDRITSGLALDLVIVDGASGKVVGEVGISNLDAHRRAALIGYWLLDDARGRGLAGQAVDAFSTWLLGDLGLRLLVARCAVANVASHRVASSAGYQFRRVDETGFQLWALSGSPESER
jgi:RimJ/RimL family protein N-acetyltransferase